MNTDTEKSKMCIVFDLDGVLLDYKERFYQTYRTVLELMNISVPDKELLWKARKGGLTSYEMLDDIILPAGTKERSELIRKIQNERIRAIELPEFLGYDCVFSGVHETIKALMHYPLFLLTARKNRTNLMEQLRDKKLEFNQVFSAPVNKEGFKTKILEQLKKKYSHVIFVSDLGKELREARKVGIMTVAVLSGVDGEDVLKKSGAEHIINSVNDLTDILEENK